MFVGLIALGLLVPSARAETLTDAQLANRRCFNCHSQTRIGELTGDERRGMVRLAPEQTALDPAPRPGLLITAGTLSHGVHADLACTSCHAQAQNLPHSVPMTQVNCESCHADAAANFRRGAHAAAATRHDQLAPTCVTCHGSHDIRPKTDRQSTIHPFNAIQLCGNCHEKHTANPDGTAPRQHIENYLDSVHGQAVNKGGLLVAATCVDCHRAHDVLPSSDPQSAAHRGNIPQTCGQCHLGVAETYAKSIHGQLVAEQRPDAPVCSDCHTAHAISRTSTPQFKLDLVNECGSCHDKPPRKSTTGISLYDTFRASYHGQVTELGSTRAARCSDCHGAHDIRRVEDAESRLALPHNRVTTCQQCHENADASFAQFHAHADFRDRRNYPVLWAVWMYFIIVMSCAFGFFGLHSVLWFLRSLYNRVRHGAHPRHVAHGHAIERFNKTDRINHAFVIITFFGLTLTGMPLLFSDTEWGKFLAACFGGVTAAGIIHRLFAIILAINFLVHGWGVLKRFRERKVSFWQWLFGPNSMVPRWKDFTDCLGMWRWFFVGGQKPKFDRWVYWEKFDYWAEIFGTGIIGGSGLLLWFPEFFAQFMPGWMFNVATIVHGYEAMLAVGFIFTIHFFNAHLRLEKFPVDDVMFTGRLPEEEFKEERPMEYERLVAAGELEKYRVPVAPRWHRPLAVLAGVVAMAIGTTIVALIVLAGLDWL